ncbi:MAG: hypothetical protein QG648_67 [Patescibacteria group bacterium]|nr:hypothetical protein [Patescibacteria group bacterium]
MIILSFWANHKKYQVTAESGDELLFSLDKFLKKNRISFKKIRRFALDTSQEKSITSLRIAQVILKALNIARE